jgi:hypothetical protein
LSNSFSNQVTDTKMILAYDASYSKMLFTKTFDMMQALNITIDYVDSDGD